MRTIYTVLFMDINIFFIWPQYIFHKDINGIKSMLINNDIYDASICFRLTDSMNLFDIMHINEKY